MNGLSLYEKVVLLLQTAGLALLLGRMLSTGLAEIYRYFFGYLLVNVVQITLPFLVKNGTNTYAALYFATEAVTIVFDALIVLELYSVLFHDREGIANYARRYTKWALGVAIAGSVLLAFLAPVPGQLLAIFFAVEQPIVSSLVFFVLLLSAFLCYYPITLPRNALVYSIGYAFYFLLKATTLLIRNVHAAPPRFLPMILPAVFAAVVWFWSLFLSRQGEFREAVVGHLWGSPEDDEKALRHLEAINTTLLRTSRKISTSGRARWNQ